MPQGYVPIFLFLVIAIAFPIVTLMAAKLIRPSSPTKLKLEAYECGIEAVGNSRGRYAVRFYIISILFVIFDVETVLPFPWAVQYRQLGLVWRCRNSFVALHAQPRLRLADTTVRIGVDCGTFKRANRNRRYN